MVLNNKPFSISNLWERHGAIIITALCLLLILAAWFAGTRDMHGIQLAWFIAAYIVGGFEKAKEGLLTLVKDKELDVDLLMVVAAVGAAAIGYWMDGAILIFIFCLSGALERYTMDKTNRSIQSLMKLRPQEAVVLENGVERRMKVENLKKGDIILVRPGERIAADGEIITGYSAIDQSSITGESIPVDKRRGDEIFFGTINGQGALEIQVTKPAEETMIAKIIHLVSQAQEEKPPSQQFVERFESIYAKIVVAVALILLLAPPLLFNHSWNQTVYRAMIFLVVASPCALVSSIMPAVLSAISNAARKGILFKGGAHLENLGRIEIVAFDKTGTLTEGNPIIMDIIPMVDISEEEFLRITASVETLSEHPIAKAIVKTARDRSIILSKPGELQAVVGLGVTGILDGKKIRIGKLDMFKDILLSKDYLDKATSLEEEGKTVMFVSADNTMLGILSVADIIRAQARKVIEELKAKGIRVAMLTGNTQKTANAIGKQAGVDKVFAELSPQQKVETMKMLESKYGRIAMVGDGVNDAPALAIASVGIAMGSSGTDVAMETADVILMSDKIENIPYAIQLGKRTSRVVKQNLAFAIAVVLALITLNFTGAMISLPVGVVGHEGSTVLVILSGLRLLK